MTIKYYKRKGTAKETIFLAAYIFYLIASIITWTNIPTPFLNGAAIRVGLSFFLIVDLFLESKMSVKNLIAIFFLSMLCIVVSFVSASKTGLITLLVFILCARDIDYRIYLQWYFIIGTVILVSIICLSFAGLIESAQWVRVSYENSNSYVRYSLGFKYTTFGPLLYMCVVFSYMAIKRAEINIIETAIILFTNCFMYFCTNTRAVFLLICLAIILFWIKRFFPFILKSRLFSLLCTFATPLLAAASIILPLLFKTGNDWINKLDNIMSHRLNLGYLAILKYGLSSLIGHNIEWTGSLNGDLVDSSFLRILLEYGWIVFIVVILGFMIIQFKNCHMGNYGLAILIFLYMLHSFTDPQLLTLSASPFLLMLGSIFNPLSLNSGMSHNDFYRCSE